MRERVGAPDAVPDARLPWRPLVLPPLLPVAVYVALKVAERRGVIWNVHGWGGVVGLLLFLLAIGVAALELVLVSRRLWILARVRERRSLANAAPVLVPFAFLVIVVALLSRG